jgi:hypothetical protein
LDPDILDLVEEAHITFEGEASGEIAFGALKGFLDVRYSCALQRFFRRSAVSPRASPARSCCYFGADDPLRRSEAVSRTRARASTRPSARLPFANPNPPT